MAKGDKRDYVVTRFVQVYTLVQAKSPLEAKRIAGKRGLSQGCAPSPKVAWRLPDDPAVTVMESRHVPPTRDG